MPESIDMHTLDEVPDTEAIATLREQAETKDEAVGVTFPTSDGTQKRLVVSPRGTCVLLTDVSEETFNQSLSAAEVAEALKQ